jgi:hypothetical protein
MPVPARAHPLAPAPWDHTSGRGARFGGARRGRGSGDRLADRRAAGAAAGRRVAAARIDDPRVAAPSGAVSLLRRSAAVRADRQVRAVLSGIGCDHAGSRGSAGGGWAVEAVSVALHGHADKITACCKSRRRGPRVTVGGIRCRDVQRCRPRWERPSVPRTTDETMTRRCSTGGNELGTRPANLAITSEELVGNRVGRCSVCPTTYGRRFSPLLSSAPPVTVFSGDRADGPRSWLWSRSATDAPHLLLGDFGEVCRPVGSHFCLTPETRGIEWGDRSLCTRPQVARKGAPLCPPRRTSA